MKNNRGFSLLEVIVVVAVLAVLSGIAVMAVMNTGSWKVKKSTELLNGSMAETKVEAMSKVKASLTISVDASGVWYIQRTGEEKEKLADKNMVISYTEEGSATEHAIGAGSPLEFSFSRSSGAFTPIIDGENADGSFQYRTKNIGGTSGMVYCRSIIIRCNNKSSETVLVKNTGKYYVK